MPKKTILNWIYAGKLTFALHLGKQWRFHEADVEAFERKQKIGRKP